MPRRWSGGTVFGGVKALVDPRPRASRRLAWRDAVELPRRARQQSHPGSVRPSCAGSTSVSSPSSSSGHASLELVAAVGLELVTRRLPPQVGRITGPPAPNPRASKPTKAISQGSTKNSTRDGDTEIDPRFHCRCCRAITTRQAATGASWGGLRISRAFCFWFVRRRIVRREPEAARANDCHRWWTSSFKGDEEVASGA